MPDDVDQGDLAKHGTPSLSMPELKMAEQQERRSVGERREQLIEAAVGVLAREGFAAATTRRITDEAGLALGAFHYAFRNKDDLLEAAMERLSSGVESVLQRSILEPNATLERFGEQVARSFWEYVEETPELQLAQYELTVHALRDPRLRPLAKRQYERITEAVNLAIEDHPDVADDLARRDIVAYVVSVMDGLVLHRIVEDDPEAARRRLELFISTLPALADQLRRRHNSASIRSA